MALTVVFLAMISAANAVDGPPCPEKSLFAVAAPCMDYMQGKTANVSGGSCCGPLAAAAGNTSCVCWFAQHAANLTGEGRLLPARVTRLPTICKLGCPEPHKATLQNEDRKILLQVAVVLCVLFVVLVITMLTYKFRANNNQQ